MRYFSALGILSGMFAASFAVCGANYEHNWPQWRGPNGNGLVEQGDPPLKWSESRNIRWKARIPGSGHATPIIWDNQVFVLTAAPVPKSDGAAAGQSENRGEPGGWRGGPPPTDKYEWITLCLDRTTGKTLWKQVGRREVPHEGHQSSNTYASGSPVTDGEHVISFFGSRGLYCYDMEGNLVWEKDLGKMRTRNSFGEGASPALRDDTLIVLWDTEEESRVYAFDKATGRELWKRERDERTSWTTPFFKDFGGRTQVIINGSTAVRSYDLKTGDLIWQCSGQTANAVPTIVDRGDVVYATSGFRGSAAMAIQLGQTGDLTDTASVLWTRNRATPYVPSPLVYGDLLYLCKGNDEILTCVDAKTGEPHYEEERLQGLSGIYASPIGVNNRVYIAGRNGATVVIEKSPTLKVLALNELDEPINASPAVVGRDLFLRGSDHLYCIREEE